MKINRNETRRNIPVTQMLLRLLALVVCVLTASQTAAQSAPAWTSIGPVGGSITTLLADPLAPKTTIYAGSDANGVFLSTDTAATWRTANNGMPAGRHICALASLGSYVYAATDSGVYVSPAGGAPAWSALPLPRSLISPTVSPCDFSLLTTVPATLSVPATLYMAAAGESTVYSTISAGINPGWSPTSLQPDSAGNVQSLSTLGVLGGDIAVGTIGTVFLADRSKGSFAWRDSEEGLTTTSVPMSRVLTGGVTALVSSSKWTFVCTGYDVYQADLTAPFPLIWTSLNINSSVPCTNLTIAQVNSQSELVVATSAGALVSNGFDDNSPIAGSLVPGPNFSMTSVVNGALQLDPASRSNLLWATGFGLYGSSASDLNTVTSLGGSTPASLNGPSKVSAPSQRLENVNVQDVAVIGSTLYAIADSNPSYNDVMMSTDGGATWARTGLSSTFVNIGTIRSLVADSAHKVLYAGTDMGAYYLQTTGGWQQLPFGANSDVRALAVGAQALYTVLRDSSSSNGYLVVQSLAGTSFFDQTSSLPPEFNVRALVVSGAAVYVGGTTVNAADTAQYDNAVLVAADGAPASLAWNNIGSSPFVTSIGFSKLAVGATQVFAGGDGYLMQCDCVGKTGGWGAVQGFSSLLAVNALASDGTTLYVGTTGGGLLALTLGSNTANLVAINGTGTTGLTSAVVNGLRFINGQLYAATAAGLSIAGQAAIAANNGSGGGGGGGCSMATAGEPDPLLWLLVGIAALQIAIARRRRVLRTKCNGSASQDNLKDCL